MLTEIIMAGPKGYMALRVLFMKASERLAVTACPEEDYGKLLDCFRDSKQMVNKVIGVTDPLNNDARFLWGLFEKREDGFADYSDLMAFWAKQHADFPMGCSEREEHPKVFPVLWTAKSFHLNFQGLPRATQFFLNASLGLTKSLLIKTIERGTDEYEAALPK